MTKFDETIEQYERRSGRGVLARGGWANPLLGVLGALALGGYWMFGYAFTPVGASDEPTFRR
jgi:hypothetical protein